MKTSAAKYEEAVKRNFKYMKSHPKKYRDAFEEKGLGVVKHKLGIQKDDESQDDKILSIVNKETKNE